MKVVAPPMLPFFRPFHWKGRKKGSIGGVSPFSPLACSGGGLPQHRH